MDPLCESKEVVEGTVVFGRSLGWLVVFGGIVYGCHFERVGVAVGWR
jgi:hypothetical protein